MFFISIIGSKFHQIDRDCSFHICEMFWSLNIFRHTIMKTSHLQKRSEFHKFYFYFKTKS